MADLEEMGYLAQPHTSAGRVPTDKAYRFYVDHLERMPWVGGRAGAPRGRAGRARERRGRAAHGGGAGRLSRGTHMTGILLAPPLKHTALDRIELVALGEDRALAVLVTDTRLGHRAAAHARRARRRDELREIGRALTRRYRGKTFQDILDDLAAPADPLDPLWTRSRPLLEQVVALLRDRTLYMSGATNMLDHPDLSDVATCARLLSAFEEKARLIDLLSRMAEERGIQVMIGGENPVEEMRDCSLITSTYTYRDQVLGVLGVVGPRRMAYSDVMSLVDETARLVSSVARPACGSSSTCPA